jgi:hypothetical protein
VNLTIFGDIKLLYIAYALSDNSGKFFRCRRSAMTYSTSAWERALVNSLSRLADRLSRAQTTISTFGVQAHRPHQAHTTLTSTTEAQSISQWLLYTTNWCDLLYHRQQQPHPSSPSSSPPHDSPPRPYDARRITTATAASLRSEEQVFGNVRRCLLCPSPPKIQGFLQTAYQDLYPSM